MLGQTYAALFPDKVRSLTIDGVLNAQAWSTGGPGESSKIPFTARIGSAQGAYAAFEQFSALCAQAGASHCPLAAGMGPRRKFDRLARRLAKEPLELSEGFVFGYAELVSATLSVLYSPSDWQLASAQLQDVYDLVFPTPSLRSATTRRATQQSVADLVSAAGSSTPRWRAPTPGLEPRLRRSTAESLHSSASPAATPSTHGP